MKISQRLTTVPSSPMRKLAPLAQKAEKNGVTVYHLNIGDPDIPTPEVMVNVLKNWDLNPIGYDNSQGNPEFIAALLFYYHKLGYGWLEKEQIQVTAGGSEAISMAMFAVGEPGDEIIVFEPFYANYNAYAVVNGIKLVSIPTAISNGFHLPPLSEIEAKITSRTRAILICNPNNPTGTVYTAKEMEDLVVLVKKHNLFLLSDEVYREYIYDGKKQVSLLNYMPEIPGQAIMLDSMSKRYSLCGVRLGCLVSRNPEIMAGVLKIGMGRLSCGLIDQKVAAKLTEVPDSYIEGVRRDYEKRRMVLYEGLSKIPGVVIPKPEGAFYSIVSLPVDDAEKYASWLLTDFRDHNETVMVAPASGFYTTPGQGSREVRIAYVLNTAKMERAVGLIELSLKAYSGRTRK